LLDIKIANFAAELTILIHPKVMENTPKNLFETIAETQKQVMDNMANATQKMASTFMNNEMNSDFFKKWYDAQMSFFAKNNTENNPNQTFNHWMNNQFNLYKEYMNMFQNNIGNMANMGNNTDMGNMVNNWMNTMNSTMQTMLNSMNNNTEASNTMKGMFNNAEVMMKMYELWMPFMKSVSDKTFTPEQFKNMFNPSLFKDMMDKALNMQPDFMKNMMDMNAMRNQVFNMMDGSKANMDQMRTAWMNMNPVNAQTFAGMQEQYSKMWEMMNQASAPLMKMMGNNNVTQSMNMMNDTMDKFNKFMITNAQLQYNTYMAGMEGANEFAENVYQKMKNGDDMSDFMNVYSELLNTIDKHLTALFSTPEYSKLQAQLNTVGMRLKQHMDKQMERAMENIPVVPRSEMDELYKTVYELKKRVNMLEKQLDAETEVAAEPKPAAKKSTKNNQ
jgi:hypothetical protein